MIAAREPQLMRVDPRPLRSAITGLYQETVGGAESAMMYHWVELIHLLVTRMAQPWRSDDRLWRVWEAVDADLARPWALRDLAKLACVSGEHLRRLTQKQFGRSPLEQVTYLRMRKAAALLSSTPQKIETIGWADQALGNRPVGAGEDPSPEVTEVEGESIRCQRWLGGLLSHYYREAA
jgi:hypothetical protein